MLWINLLHYLPKTEYGCLLPSLPSDAVFDQTSGVSFLCDLNDNIPAPWPSTSQGSSSSACNKCTHIPSLSVENYLIMKFFCSQLYLIVTAAIINIPALPAAAASGQSCKKTFSIYSVIPVIYEVLKYSLTNLIDIDDFIFHVMQVSTVTTCWYSFLSIYSFSWWHSCNLRELSC